MRTQLPFALLATALACSLFAAPAHALRARVFVAKTGADAGACSFSAPCQSLDFALNGVEPGGEITILDSAGYNPITITKGVTITAPPGVEPGIAAPAGGTAITIMAGPTDVVVLRGLTLEGAATGQAGIAFADGGTLEIADCVIQNFTQSGIVVATGGDSERVLISNTRVSDNATNGINLAPQGGSVQAAIDRVTIFNNGSGIVMNSTGTPTGGVIFGAITNSVISSNANTGIVVTTTGSAAGVDVTVKDSSVTEHFGSAGGISVSSNASKLILSHSVVNHNLIAIVISNGGVVLSALNNDMTENGTLISGGSLGSAPEQ